jgi:hypothetical protein
MRYECVGIQDYDRVDLRIDRRSPLTASKWTAFYTVRRQRTVCAQYGVNSRGQSVCIATRTETYDEPHTQSGVLRVRVKPPESGSAPTGRTEHHFGAATLANIARPRHAV